MFTSVTLITLALTCSALAQVHHVRGPVPFLYRTEVHDDFGQSASSYTTGDGITRSAHNVLKQTPEGDYYLSQTGQVSYTSPEGIPVSFSYIGDENGFRAEGTHIPKQPLPVPIH
ncbi:hypothetical protein GE061_009624 [Apolygus lucorum]|uniref:Uncharacterized protein n=1 Tax=Apolygus lucorum TaxID=248454 RepID=A0A6A4JZ07_APOLU|nr:hypothetical protein GE061_009624 [Apolygus lucorum]